MFKTIYDYSGLDPASLAISEVRDTLLILINDILSIRIMSLDNLPSPSPREIGETILLLGVFIAVDFVQDCKG